MKQILLCAILLIFSIAACEIGGSTEDLKNKRKITEEGICYELFYIENMPCMRIGRSLGDSIWDYDGVTCDWSKWEPE